MAKVDFTKELKQLYRPPATTFAVVDVPPMTFLMLDGHGDPNTAQEYRQALEALYAVAYRAKFISKDELGKDYVVPPLEGLWWAEDMDTFTVARDKSAWDWTMMILLPDWITAELYQRAVGEVRPRRRLQPSPVTPDGRELRDSANRAVSGNDRLRVERGDRVDRGQPVRDRSGC